jgi:hypothetical protein
MTDEPIGNYTLTLEEPPLEMRHVAWVKAGERDGKWVYEGTFDWVDGQWVQVMPIEVDRSSW